MDAFQYWRQPTWAYTTNEEPEQKYHGLEIILQELERQREERLREERERRLDDMLKFLEKSREGEKRLQQEREIRMENTMKSFEKKCKEINEGLENIDKMMSEVMLPCFEEKSIIEEEKEEPSRSKWEEMLETCIIEVEENRKVTNQRLMNLERNTDLLEQGSASLVAQVEELENNMGTLVTAIERKEKEKGPTDPSPAVDHPQRPAAHLHSGPLGTSQPPEPDSDTDVEQPPATTAPLCSCPLPESQSLESQFPSTNTMTMPPQEDEEDETNKTVVNPFEPFLSIILIHFIADKADFGEDSQLSHAWRKSWSNTKKSKFKLRSCPKYLRYNLCGFNLMCPLSHYVSIVTLCICTIFCCNT